MQKIIIFLIFSFSLFLPSINVRAITTNEAYLDFNVSNNCSSYFGSPEDKEDPAYYLQFGFNLLKYASIILLFGLTIADFAKSTISDKQDELPKTLKKALKRLIVVVIIFFIPIIIQFAFEMFGIYTDPSCVISSLIHIYY